ncbi:tetratricopeptide repeat protein [Micromonospora sp. WMMD980]|uniref:tetratricopeptide repeat protein n=1 Tax=Micromonospora sp. WMMD980 TaxID=3016088 RepID=UPI002415FEC2|nr:tetratricopeptide repeat protein [Micromonospora sp. WMMD980]MDG4802377.1 tetratricopeptide repeat protein [Micromonospora sp. WMMD980]
MTTARLVTALRDLGLDPTPRQIAEALWLARFLPGTPRTAPDRRPPAAEPIEPPPAAESSTTAPADPEPAVRPGPEVALHVPQARRTGTAGALRIRVPAPPALDFRALVRSLRPLRRRVPDPRTLIVDEEATARRVVEQDLWVPVLRPVPQPWFDLTLAVDSGASMALWAPQISELERVLTRLRAFRRIERVRLPATGVEPPGAVWPGVAGRSTRELLDPRGRRLILVVSDCAGPGWHDGSLFRTLQTWARHETVAILQPLPQRMWRRSGLVPVRGRLSAAAGVSTNSRLRFTPRQWRPDLLRVVPVPVLQLQPDWMAGWARLTGTGTGTIDAVITLPPRPAPPPAERAGAARPDDAVRRLSRFRATASPEALRLATQLADLPITLPIMRLVQRASALPPHPAYLAEVLLGGLLVADPDRTGELRFDFQPGVRPLLRDLLLRTDLLRLRHEIARFLAGQMGIGMREFVAALSAPAGMAGDAALGASFGRLPTTVLARLGGRHRELVGFVERREPPVEQADRVNGNRLDSAATTGDLLPEVEQDQRLLAGAIRSLRHATATGRDRRALVALARALRTRFALGGDVTDLVESASILDDLRRAGGKADAELTADLAEVRLALFTARGTTGDLNDAVLLFRAVAATEPATGRGRVGLARALVVRAERLGVAADLDEAITLYLAAAAVVADDDEERTGLRLRAVDALLQRYALTGDPVALRRADVESDEVADTPGRRSRRIRLAGLLREAARRGGGDLALLRRAADLYAEAAGPPGEPGVPQGSPPDADEEPDGPHRVRVLRGLAEVRADLFQVTGDPRELDAAVATARDAVTASVRDDVTHAQCLVILVRVLRLRLRRAPDAGTLDELVDTTRRLLDAVPGSHPDRHQHLALLGDALRARYAAEGEAGDIQEACARYEEAVRVCPATAPQLGDHLAELGEALRARAERFESRSDLDAAREALERSVAATAGDDPRHADRLILLAGVLGALGEPARAVPRYRQAVELRGRRYGPDGDPTIEARVALGRALVGLGRFAEARQELRAVVDVLAQRLGPDHRRTRTARYLAAVALVGLGDPGRAAGELRAMLAGPGDPGGAGAELREVLAAQARAGDPGAAATRELLRELAAEE